MCLAFRVLPALAILSVLPVLAEPTSYRNPSAEVQAVLDARVLPSYSVAPGERTLAILESRRYPGIEELARPFLGLAGLRIDPASNGPHRTGHLTSVRLRPALQANAPEVAVPLPAQGSFYGFKWSPDGERFLLNRRTDGGTELWKGDTSSGRIQPIAGLRLRAGFGAEVVWLGAGEIVVLAVPEGRGAPPVSPRAPAGPVIQESFGKSSPERTYPDLLKSPHDEALLDHYGMAQLVRVDLRTDARRAIGAPALVVDLALAGDGRHLLVERVVKPYRYNLPLEDFGRVAEIIDLDGRPLREVARVPVKENVPIQGVAKGPRDFVASPLADGAVYYAEALDDGDPRKKVPHRDRLLRLDPPYTGEPREVLRFQHRFRGLAFTDQPDRAIAVEFDRDRVWVTGRYADLSGGGKDGAVLYDLSVRDRYNNPGIPVRKPLPTGRTVVPVVDGEILFIGQGASPSGDRPFLDRVKTIDRSRVRLFQASETHYEMPVRMLDGRGERFITSRESRTDPPNLFLRGPDTAPVALTQSADPTPQLRAIRKELVRFKRADGVDLSFWMYLPPDHRPGEKRPTFVWAYPMEYTDPMVAGQVAGSPNRFAQFGGTNPLFLVLDGFIVLDDATMPVVGNPETVNNTFVEQITANAEAILAKAEALGVTDRTRAAVGGHSYGAFMTANLLAHTDLFRAGIARSGAYNRTLTPFGFQAERRSLWEAPETYVKLSPFMVANKLKEPLLLIHGEADNNTGTFPIQSERFFQALAGTGGNVRYVVLPHEAHGYASRESVGHVLWEMSDWLIRQLGNPRGK